MPILSAWGDFLLLLGNIAVNLQSIDLLPLK